MSNKYKHLHEFKDFHFDMDSLELTHRATEIHLPPKALQILKVLIENQGELVGRDFILEEVWADTFVEDANLTVMISQIRKTFLKYDKDATFVETIPKRGYRFSADVRKIVEEIDDSPLIIERHTLERLTIEEQDDFANSEPRLIEQNQTFKNKKKNRIFIVVAIICGLFLFSGLIWKNYSSNHDKSVKVDINIKSLAVLPLKNLTETQENESLSLGLTDNLITRLGSLNHFTVRPLSTVTKFDESGKDAIQFAKYLQVDAVLTGTIQTADNRIRINARLINLSDGSQIWEGTFDETETDIFKLQNEFSVQVAESLFTRLTQNEQKKLSESLTENNEAYQEYLKGRYFWSKRTKADLLTAISFYEKAIILDPNFAEAYVGLADSQFLLFDYNWDISPENPQRAKENLLKALSIKSDLAGALSTLGLIQTTFYLDWKAAETSFEKALELEPSLPEALLRYGSLLIRLRRFPEAQKILAKAQMIDPLSVGINMNYAVSFLHANDLETAEDHFKQTLEIAPKFTPARWYLGRCYWQQGKKDKAVAEFVKALEVDGETETAEKMSNTKGDVDDKIRVWQKDWLEKFNSGENNAHDLAIVSSFLNDKDATIANLEIAVEKRNVWASWINSEPEFDFIRNEPRFIKLLEKMNFDEGGN